MASFKEFDLDEKIIESIEALGFVTPTPIQEECIPHLLATDQDMIALAQTGTGKTAAFGLPAVHLTDISDKSTQTIILSPTRELGLQIAKDIGSYSKFVKGLNVVAVYGGASIQDQIKQLNRGAHIVIGTPGRTVDLINRKKLKLNNVKRVILDEADEMLTMGFKEDLTTILSETPDEKQTMLFSATMSKEIKKIAKKYMDDPREVAVAKVNQGADTVEHIYYSVQSRDKYEVLKRIADLNPNVYGIVFCRTRRETNDIANRLMQDGYNADVLNGDLSQAQRDKVMGNFRKRAVQILVATDVAARGLDVNDLTHVINYNLPDDSEVYTHRSGRTGRAGKKGISIAISHSREGRKLRDIERVSGIKFKKENVPSGEEICKIQLLALMDRIKEVKVDEKQIEPFLPAIYETLEGLSREELIQHFVSSEFNKFLSYYKHARDLNVGGDRKERGSRKEKHSVNYAKMYINVGSKKKLTPERLMGIINEALDSGSVSIGKIEVLKKFSFFEIEQDSSEKLVKKLTGEEFEGVDLSVEISLAKSDMGGFGKRGGQPRSKSFGGGKKRRWAGKKDDRGGRGGGKKKRRY